MRYKYIVIYIYVVQQLTQNNILANFSKIN